MKVLVTGATGFIGSYLTQMLVNQGYEVKALIRPSSHSNALKALGIEVIQGDIQDIDSLKKAMKGSQQVYHAAAQRTQVKVPKKTYYSVNIEGARNLTNLAHQLGIERLVYLSSTGVYGRMPKEVKATEKTLPKPDTYYRTTKLLAEQIFLTAYQKLAIPIVIARLSGVCGIGSLSNLGLIRAIATGNFRLIGTGDNYYHLGHITDIVEGLRLCAETPNIEGNIYNIAGKHPIKVKDLVKIIAQSLNIEQINRHLPILPYQVFETMTEFVYHTAGRQLPGHHRYDMFLANRNIDISKAMTELNYAPQVSSEVAITEVVSWYKEKGFI